MYQDDYSIRRLVEVSNLLRVAQILYTNLNASDFSRIYYNENPVNFCQTLDYIKINKNANFFQKSFGKWGLATVGFNPCIGFVGLTDTSMVIALRGCNGPMELLSCMTGGVKVRNGESKEVNEVFWDGSLVLVNQIVPILQKNPREKVIIAGYSLGGALGQLLAQRLVLKKENKGLEFEEILTYCFGAPAVGPIDLEMSSSLVSVWADDDIIPVAFSTFLPFLAQRINEIVEFFGKPFQVCSSSEIEIYRSYRHPYSSDMTSIILEEEDYRTHYYPIDESFLGEHSENSILSIISDTVIERIVMNESQNFNDAIVNCLKAFHGNISKRHGLQSSYIPRLNQINSEASLYW